MDGVTDLNKASFIFNLNSAEIRELMWQFGRYCGH